MILIQIFHLQMEVQKNLSFFGVNMSSYVNTDNKNKDIFVLGEEPTHKLDDTTSAEAKYLINLGNQEEDLC